MFHPILLTGVALVGLPILLHLIMKQEPKRLLFPAFRFLKQKRFINQRKLRLRHLVLMALRMGLIALICFALFQPTLVSEGFNLRTEQPVAAVMVIDTSPSMGYAVAEQRSGLSDARKRGLQLLEETLDGPWTAFDDARYRLLEMLNELPSSSKVAIVDTADRDDPLWALNLDEAKKRVRNLKRTKASSGTVTRALERAYNLFARLERESENPDEILPRLLVVFSDRTTTSWDAARTPDLQKFRDRASINSTTQEKIDINSLFLDVGVDKPAANMSIAAIEMRPQLISPYQTAAIGVRIDANVKEGDNVLSAKIERIAQPRDFSDTQQKPIKLDPDGKAFAEFRWNNLNPGAYQVEFKLDRPDAMAFDNVRYWTFRVREPRRILALADIPPEIGVIGGGLGLQARGQLSAGFLQLALRVKGWYEAEIRSTAEQIDFNQYEAVVLNGVDEPSEELWRQLFEYVKAGGRVAVFPSPTLNPKSYESAGAQKLLPVKFAKLVDLPDTKEGTKWAWNALNYGHPFLEPFGRWKELPNIDFFSNPPMAWRYWEIENADKQALVVPFADAPDADKRHPALLEWNIDRGRVLLFATDWSLNTVPRSHNYASTSFFLVVSNEMVRHLIGDVEDRNFNHKNGENVLIKWPADADAKKPFYLSGPDIVGTDAIVKRVPPEEYLRLGPEKIGSAGNFAVSSEDGAWLEAFSANPTPQESELDRVPIDQIEELLGKNAVAPAAKDLKISEVLKGKFSAPIELFPFLMILLLLFMAFENWLSNRFYKQPKGQAGP